MNDWDQIATAIKRGELIVLPTDTVYGIGCDPYSESAVADLLETKGRGKTMPPPVLAADARQAFALANWDMLPKELRDGARDQAVRLANAYWPGALTLIVPTSCPFGWDMETHGRTVAVRVPDEPLTRGLLSQTGPLAVTSANLTGQTPAVTARQARDYFADRVFHYVDGGTAKVGKASTIIDVTGGPLRVVRSGALDWGEIKQTLEG